MSILSSAVLGNGLASIRGVHGKLCHAPDKPCSCSVESTQYGIAGLLSVTGGVGEFCIGLLFSMLTLSASLHSFADGLADWWGVWIARKAQRNPLNAEAIRKKGNYVIAFLLAVSAVWVMYEASDRLFFEGHHFVSPRWIMLAGFGKGIIDALRVWILFNAQQSNPNNTGASLLIHALSDFLHSIVVFVIGGGMWVSELVATDIQKILQVADLLLSLLLAVYMMYLSKLIWQGKHHEHYLLHLLSRLMGKELPHH